MMLWVSFLVGVGFTALAAWLLVRQLVSKQQQAHAFALLEAQQDTQATLQQLRHELETQTQKAAEARTLCDTYEQRLQASQIQLVEATTEKVRLTERLEQLVSLTTEKENLALALNQAKTQQAEASATIAQLTEQRDSLHKQLTEAESHWKSQWDKDFQRFLTETVEATRKKLTDHADYQRNEGTQTLKAGLEQTVAPLKQLLSDYQTKLAELDKTHLSRFQTLDQHVLALTHAKEQLVSVLKTNRGAGHWGEMQLLRLLEAAGLKEGIHYDYQKQDTAQGRPDVKIHFAERGFIYIDAKTLGLSTDIHTSVTGAVLTHPTDDDIALATPAVVLPEMDFAQQCKKQLESLQKAIKDLKGKEYTKDLSATGNFVVLFVPLESMLSMALHEHPTLWEDAYRSNVLLASPLTLLALLRMIHLGWQKASLAENVEEIRKAGEVLHNRLYLYTERMLKVDSQLDKLNDSFTEAKKSFHGGQGIVSQLNKLEQLGCKSAKTLSEPMKELATLAGD
jgi:DNA recombination protein RmuC